MFIGRVVSRVSRVTICLWTTRARAHEIIALVGSNGAKTIRIGIGSASILFISRDDTVFDVDRAVISVYPTAATLSIVVGDSAVVYNQRVVLVINSTTIIGRITRDGAVCYRQLTCGVVDGTLTMSLIASSDGQALELHICCGIVDCKYPNISIITTDGYTRC